MCVLLLSFKDDQRVWPLTVNDSRVWRTTAAESAGGRDHKSQTGIIISDFTAYIHTAGILNVYDVRARVCVCGTFSDSGGYSSIYT